jgi:hypothetical protein
MNEIKSGIDEPHASPHDESEALPTGSSLHPRIYTIVNGLAVWFVLAAWIFAGGGISDYLLLIVSGFIGVCIGLTLILASVATVEKLPTGEPSEGEPKRQSFRDWARGSFGTWSGPLSGKQATVQVLLPFAAAALGMTIFGFLLRFAAAGA